MRVLDEPRSSERRFVRDRLLRLLRRRRRMAELRLCEGQSPCAWHRRALDAAIVSYVAPAHRLGLRLAGARSCPTPDGVADQRGR